MPLPVFFISLIQRHCDQIPIFFNFSLLESDDPLRKKRAAMSNSEVEKKWCSMPPFKTTTLDDVKKAATEAEETKWALSSPNHPAKRTGVYKLSPFTKLANFDQ